MCVYHCAQLSYTTQHRCLHRTLFWLCSLLTSPPDNHQSSDAVICRGQGHFWRAICSKKFLVAIHVTHFRTGSYRISRIDSVSFWIMHREKSEAPGNYHGCLWLSSLSPLAVNSLTLKSENAARCGWDQCFIGVPNWLYNKKLMFQSKAPIHSPIDWLKFLLNRPETNYYAPFCTNTEVGWVAQWLERWSLTGELSCPIHARPAADGWPLMWVSRPL